MEYDVIVVGSGASGLTSAAYLSRDGYKTLLCEKEDVCGGLIRSFTRNGFTYDAGIRAFEDSGILFPMLRQLGISIDFLDNPVKLGVEDKIIKLDTPASVQSYQDLLVSLYPESEAEIIEIVKQIRKIMHYMDVQYGIENPMFLDVKEDRDYFIKEVFPWMFKYAITSPKIAKLHDPVGEFLKRFTKNQSLLDIIIQHFFQATPAFFALSYITLYLDYHYPLGGTGTLVEKMTGFIRDHGGEIRNNCHITSIDAHKNCITDTEGNAYSYKKLVWAADLYTLFEMVDPNAFADPKVRESILSRKAALEEKTGGDSIFTTFVGVDIEPDYFRKRASAHFFYTPSKVGQSAAGQLPLGKDREEILAWLDRFLALTTYEIAIPALRDPSLAPKGKTGLVISLLFDYQLTQQIAEAGWYEEFKELTQNKILQTLEEAVFPGLRSKIEDISSSTPLTIARTAGTRHGAITGWAFTNQPVPAESRLPKVLNSIKNPIPNVVQSGQWTFSPSGLPTAILTGKMAADRVMKELKR